jgi:hypothetical protein
MIVSSIFLKDICFAVSWDPSNFTFNPGDKYEMVWKDEFENVGPAKAIIDGKLSIYILFTKIQKIELIETGLYKALLIQSKMCTYKMVNY